MPHPNHQGLSALVNDQIRRRSTEHGSGITFHTACIPETCRQRGSIKANQPNQPAQQRHPRAQPTSAHPHPRDQISIARGSRLTTPHARSFIGGFRTTAPVQSLIVAMGRHPKPFTKWDLSRPPGRVGCTSGYRHSKSNIMRQESGLFSQQRDNDYEFVIVSLNALARLYIRYLHRPLG